MQNDIKKAIEDIYINGNTELFISKCRDTVDFLDELLEGIPGYEWEVFWFKRAFFRD